MSVLSFAKSTAVLFVQKLLPVHRGRVLFTSFDGHYSDNPKYISQALHALKPDAEIVWLVKQPYRALLPDYVKAVDINNRWATLWYRGTARAIVDNVYGKKADQRTANSRGAKLKFAVNGWLKNKRRQHVFTTWHGTPLKRMGRDQVGCEVRDFSCPRTTMLLGNRYTLDIMQRLTFNKIRMELIGTPRNDVLFGTPEQAEVLKAKLGLPQNKKILLFAPTFRSDGDGIGDRNIQRSGLSQLEAMDFNALFHTLSERFGGDWALVCRFHYHVEQQVDWEQLQRDYPEQIINGNAHDDMAEYLACADALLTDASSAMFDFALTDKPCFLFFPDLLYYAEHERGFYTPPEQLPFPAAVTFPELLDCIAAFDSAAYTRQIATLLHDYGYVDDKDSSERIARYVLETL